jgi:hypothetical protein
VIVSKFSLETVLEGLTREALVASTPTVGVLPTATVAVTSTP